MEEDAMSGLRIDGEDEAESRKLLQEFQRSFEQVQSVLDQNRLLIHEIGRNQAARAPVGLTRNVGLIRELNSNIWRVVDLYAGLSASFTRSVEASSEGDSAATLRPDGKPPGAGKRVRLH